MNSPLDAEPAERGEVQNTAAPLEPDELLAAVRRMERAVDEIRGRLETAARAQQHREFSVTRLLGALCQVLVVGLVAVALADWMYQGPSARLLVELALAGVLQLGVLTAAITARGVR